MQVQVTNFNFSQGEASAISERNFFLLKNSATQKIIVLFGMLEIEMKKELLQYSIDLKELNSSSGKIFRGENYKSFPYIVLDCPRLFSTNSIFAFRSMFWWGHEFSFTLHLQGEAFEKYKKSLNENLNRLSGKEVYYCVNDTPWHYNYEKDNYLPIEDFIDRREELFTKPFLKVSRKLNVDEYAKAYDYAMESFKLFMGLLKNDD